MSPDHKQWLVAPTLHSLARCWTISRPSHLTNQRAKDRSSTVFNNPKASDRISVIRTVGRGSVILGSKKSHQ